MNPRAFTDLESEEPRSPESQATDAVGDFIEFWGFKRNQGRVWALLYLKARALSATEIQRELHLSKGAVSMIARELEGWRVIRRVRAPNSSVWRFEAETDLMAMVGRVLKEREAVVFSRIKSDLDHAKASAEAAGLAAGVRDRIERLASLATLAESAVRFFVQTARIDATRAIHILKVPAAQAPKGKPK